MEGLFRFAKDRFVNGARLVDRLERQEDAPLGIDVEVRDRRGRELARHRGALLRLGPSTLAGREDREPDRHERRDGEHADEGAEPSEGSTFELLLVGQASRLVGGAPFTFGP